jgi:hypothetical protein
MPYPGGRSIEPVEFGSPLGGIELFTHVSWSNAQGKTTDGTDTFVPSSTTKGPYHPAPWPDASMPFGHESVKVTFALRSGERVTADGREQQRRCAQQHDRPSHHPHPSGESALPPEGGACALRGERIT